MKVSWCFVLVVCFLFFFILLVFLALLVSVLVLVCEIWHLLYILCEILRKYRVMKTAEIMAVSFAFPVAWSVSPCCHEIEVFKSSEDL